ncbi:MAG: hypothetical protein QXE31_05110 [Candidatus Woesearchaeota archaeon]
MSDEKKKPSFEDHSTLEDLIISRHELTQRSMMYLEALSGSIWSEVIRFTKEKNLPPEHHYKLSKEDKDALRAKIDELLSYKNEMHPLHAYVNTNELAKDEFIKHLIDNIFLPNKEAILKSVGEKDFLQKVKQTNERHRQLLEEKAAEFIFRGYDNTKDSHRKAVAKYLGIKDDTKIAAEPGRYLNQLYQNVIEKYINS